MTWETPKTWSVSEVVTAANMNTHVRDNETELALNGCTFIFDGGGAAISTASALEIPYIPYKLVLTGNSIKSLDAAANGAIVVDLWYLPTASNNTADTDSITASAPPTLTSDNTYVRDATLTGWSPTLAAGGCLRAYVESCTAITKAALALTWTRSS